MRDLKIAVIGSGSTYSPEIFEGIIKRRDSLSVKKIALMDTSICPELNFLQIVLT